MVRRSDFSIVDRDFSHFKTLSLHLYHLTNLLDKDIESSRRRSDEVFEQLKRCAFSNYIQELKQHGLLRRGIIWQL